MKGIYPERGRKDLLDFFLATFKFISIHALTVFSQCDSRPRRERSSGKYRLNFDAVWEHPGTRSNSPKFEQAMNDKEETKVGTYIGVLDELT